MTDFSKIKAITFDVDGVMTDGGLLCFDDGNFLRIFDAKDSFGLRMAQMAGIRLAVITGGTSPSITQRFRKCGVLEEDIYLHSRDKIKDFRAFCAKYGFSPEEVAYVGDDLPDVETILAAGLGVTPSDGVAEARAAADFVSEFPGGKGCISDLVERILKAQGKWKFNMDAYLKMY